MKIKNGMNDKCEKDNSFINIDNRYNYTYIFDPENIILKTITSISCHYVGIYIFNFL